MILPWDFVANSPTDHERIAWDCHTVRPKYAQRWLSEPEYRFNRRFDLPDIIPRLVQRRALNAAHATRAAPIALGLSRNEERFMQHSGVK